MTSELDEELKRKKKGIFIDFRRCDVWSCSSCIVLRGNKSKGLHAEDRKMDRCKVPEIPRDVATGLPEAITGPLTSEKTPPARLKVVPLRGLSIICNRKQKNKSADMAFHLRSRLGCFVCLGFLLDW